MYATQAGSQVTDSATARNYGEPQVGRLASVREHSRQHTYTPFQDPHDLPFFIIRDVLAKIRDRMAEPSSRTRQQLLPEGRRLQRPVGMEFLTSADRQHLYGRKEKNERASRRGRGQWNYPPIRELGRWKNF